MRSYITEVALPTLAYFAALAMCIGIMILGVAVMTDIVSDPSGIMQEDGQ